MNEGRSPEGMLRIVRATLAASLCATAIAKAVAISGGGAVQFVGIHGTPGMIAIGAVGALEASGAVLLLSPLWKEGAWVTFALGAMFGLGTAVLHGMGYPLKACGCYGQFSMPLSAHFALILGMLLGARYLLLRRV